MFRLHVAATALLLSAAVFIAPSVQAQSELEQLDAKLPGKLVNDPSRIDWESYGGDLEASAKVDKTIPGGGAARHFEIKRAREHIYTAGTNIPLIKRVKRGDDITVGFYARTIQAKSDDGKGVVRVRFQQNGPPFPGFGEKTLKIGSEWEWYEVTAKAEMGLNRKDGIVALQFGRTKQIIEIGQAIVVTGASVIADSSAPAKVQPKKVAAATEAQLPKPLQGAGLLLNRPGNRDWDMGGTAGTWQARDESQIWLGKATLFSTERTGMNASELYATVPIESAVAEGDELLIAIAARTESAESEDGRSIVELRVQDRASPDNSFANNRFKVGPKWQLIRIKTRAAQAFDAGKAEVALHFAGAKQAVEVGPVYVIKTN